MWDKWIITFTMTDDGMAMQGAEAKGHQHLKYVND